MGAMNPAALLFDLLTHYRDQEAGTIAERWHLDGDATSNGLSASDRATLLEAASWLARIDLLIDDLATYGKRTDAFRETFPIWVDSTLAIGKHWGANHSSEEICPKSAMNVLEGLINLLDTLTPAPPHAAHDQLVALVAEVSSLLDADETLSDRLRNHLRRVVDHLRQCVEHPEAYDLRDFAYAVDDVLIAAQAAEAETRDEKLRPRWQHFCDFYIAPTITGLLANVTPQAAFLVGGAVSGLLGS